MAAEPNRIPVGYVRRAHGLRGDVIVLPQSDDPNRFGVGAVFMTDEQPGRPLEVAAVRDHADGLMVRFVGIANRDSAEALRGLSITISKQERRQLDDEYWPEDLVGLEAVDTAGTALGRVEAVITGVAQDRLAVATGEATIEVPFVAALVPDVDLAGGRVVIDPPPGLFD